MFRSFNVGVWITCCIGLSFGVSPPYIRIRNDLNEPDRGFCIDVVGWDSRYDFSDLNVHSCKTGSSSTSDQNFIYDEDRNIIIGVDYSPQDGRCIAALCDETNCGLELALINDDYETNCATIEYKNDANQGELLYYPSGDITNARRAKCIRVGATSFAAHRSLSRSMYLQTCDRVRQIRYKRWDIISN